MRVTWKPTKGGFVVTVAPSQPALQGWAPIYLTQRADESEGFAAGTWKLSGPVKTNLWTGVTPSDAKKTAAKMIRAYCVAIPQK